LLVVAGARYASALAAVGAPPSRNALRFAGMCDTFREHPRDAFDRVPSKRKKFLLRTAAEALEDAKVVEAVSILYEDVAPIRIGCDLIFRKLEAAVEDAANNVVVVADPAVFVDEAALGAPVRAFLVEDLKWPEKMADRTVGTLAASVSRDHAALKGAKRAFDVVDAGATGSLTATELERLGTAVRSFGQCADCTCEKRGSCASITSLMSEVEAGDGGLGFSEFMLGYSTRFPASAPKGRLMGDRNDALIAELLGEESDLDDSAPAAADGPAKARFDGMVDEFIGWSKDPAILDRAVATNPRLARVLDGCFAGVVNPVIVDAIAVLYVDYRALRLSGDLIFKLMRKLVGPVGARAPPAAPTAAPAADAAEPEPEAEAAAAPVQAAAAAEPPAPPVRRGRVARVLARLRRTK